VTYDELVLREADAYVPAELNHHGFPITTKHGLFIGSAGVDESNAGDHLIVLPRDPQASANALRAWLAERHGPRVAAIITDRRSLPQRRGTLGIGLAHSGFAALVDHRGEPDLFGRRLETTAANVLDGLAAAVVVVCGEAAEQTPLALVTDVPFVRFQERDPTAAELAALRTTLQTDYWAPFFAAVPWRPGGGTPPA
jgi:F420-0:gamma-glutamyl ligase